MVFLNAKPDALNGARLVYQGDEPSLLYDVFVRTLYFGIVGVLLILYIWLAIADFRQQRQDRKNREMFEKAQSQN
jgi:hypothetical protein